MQSPSPKSLSVDICLSACLCLFVCTASSMVVECSAALHFCTVRHYNFVQCSTVLSESCGSSTELPLFAGGWIAVARRFVVVRVLCDLL